MGRPRAALALVTVLACGQTLPPPRPVSVFAAASLREAVGDIAREFEARTGAPVQTEFDASSVLARRIRGGAAADVFISGDREWLDAVAPAERFDWLGNHLVCITLPDAPRDCRTARTMVLGGAHVPVGKYAAAALEHIGAARPERVVYAANVRDVLRKVEAGAGDAGVVYQTDAAVSPALRVAFVFPGDSHPPIVYPAGRLTTAGAAFWQALRSPWAQDLARRRGFGVP